MPIPIPGVPELGKNVSAPMAFKARINAAPAHLPPPFMPPPFGSLRL